MKTLKQITKSTMESKNLQSPQMLSAKMDFKLKKEKVQEDQKKPLSPIASVEIEESSLMTPNSEAI